jgi:two-component system NtrC family sensor kinase
MIISGKAQLSLMEEPKDREAADNLKVIVSQCERARDILRRLLKFSKPSMGERSAVGINESLESVIALLEHQYSLENIKFERNFMQGLPPVRIDEKEIHEVFLNLLNNAYEAMHDGGTIVVSTSQEEGFIRVDFRDTGSGIAESDLSHMFEPFFTTKKSGTGLGLSVCYGIIKAHGGAIKLTSKPGKGTTATVLLPLEEEEG